MEGLNSNAHQSSFMKPTLETPMSIRTERTSSLQHKPVSEWHSGSTGRLSEQELLDVDSLGTECVLCRVRVVS